ncbi:response regulator transcription factor, partial [Vibrio parahaemolyticus]|nr:response regulator transcription factor [Vibrio parahaemolyticus]
NSVYCLIIIQFRTTWFSVRITQQSQPAIEVELTRREIQVLKMLKEGGSNMEIADSLFISEHTIKSHLYNIFRKLEVKNRTQATSWAKRNL